ncbi:MAG: OPT/YSL family transporter [Candidatus Methanomethylicia archaeon]
MIIGGFSLRSIFLSIILALLFSFINGYLSINLGMNFGFGAVAIAIAYALFHKVSGGSSRRELSIVLIASSSSMAIYNVFGFILYLIENERISLPFWMSPSMNSILNRCIDISSLIPPILFFSIETLITCIGGLIFTYSLREALINDRRMIWPYTSVEATLVDVCLKGGGHARLVGLSALIGGLITFIQYLPLFWDYDITILNLTPILPYGMIMAISFSLGFIAIGYIINVDVSLSLLLFGLITYLLISPILALYGLFKPSLDPMTSYNSLLMAFSISPSLGILLLGGGLLSILMFIKGRKSNEKSSDRLGYIQLYKIFIKFLLSNRFFGLIFLVIFSLTLILAWFLNPLYPFPSFISVLFVAYMFLLGSFIECIIITRMSGETGMGMGMIGILLYDMPLFSLGYRSYPGYWVSSFFRPSAWISNGVLPYYKYRDKFDVSWSDIIKAKLLGWIPTFISSIIFTLILWLYIGFGNTLMPAISFIQIRAYLGMLVGGNIGTIINPFLFIGGGILGALLELFTPISMFGVAMGMLLPPHYIVPMGIGGLIRWYTDRRFGKEFFKEKGSIIATGIMTSSLILQVLMNILSKFL